MKRDELIYGLGVFSDCFMYEERKLVSESARMLREDEKTIKRMEKERELLKQEIYAVRESHGNALLENERLATDLARLRKLLAKAATVKLWLISQKENDGYDTFDSAVVAAETEEDAKQIHPASYDSLISSDQHWQDWWSCWAKTPDEVSARCIGDAVEGIAAGEIICASFNAG
jgi:regulator of replication initiation timing